MGTKDMADMTDEDYANMLDMESSADGDLTDEMYPDEAYSDGDTME